MLMSCKDPICGQELWDKLRQLECTWTNPDEAAPSSDYFQPYSERGTLTCSEPLAEFVWPLIVSGCFVSMVLCFCLGAKIFGKRGPVVVLKGAAKTPKNMLRTIKGKWHTIL